MCFSAEQKCFVYNETTCVLAKLKNAAVRMAKLEDKIMAASMAQHK